MKHRSNVYQDDIIIDLSIEIATGVYERIDPIGEEGEDPAWIVSSRRIAQPVPLIQTHRYETTDGRQLGPNGNGDDSWFGKLA